MTAFRMRADKVVRYIDKTAQRKPELAAKMTEGAVAGIRRLTDAEAQECWGSIRSLPQDPQWAFPFQRQVAEEFRAKGLPAPDWTLTPPPGMQYGGGDTTWQ
ncbi:hypothetical protein [Rudaeicoccus suwonensis]|uniref:Uncharacterized protein n=1 Tax=Rudaeicoccus suwonensis TaxID=657409 RepID=A0A561E7K7_9MICO|nr:hypothetical protein [Rudaeicoccus suwonensis]TWE11592.1 hypothetical protein BKA23_0367 [Rudaeicoccus suwonensis]